MRDRPPLLVAGLAVVLLALGFVTGLGYQSRQHALQNNNATKRETTSQDAPAQRTSPLVRNLRISPNGRLAVFTAIYGNSQQAGRFVFDLRTYKWNEAITPAGWQDSIAQWNKDGTAILFEREKIPRNTRPATGGLHSEKITISEDAPIREEIEPLEQDGMPPGEKPYAGFWSPGNMLVIKTRRESKALFQKQDGTAQLVDSSPGTYYQNRAVQENGQTVFYVVRDISVENGTVGVFRIQNGKSKQLGPALTGVTWAYLAEDAHHLIICREADEAGDWPWTLYDVSTGSLKALKQATVPKDVIAVYWSPDYKQILGAAGKSLWIVSVPDLKARKLGTHDDWNADDAAWIDRKNAVLIASQGKLWQVDTQTGNRLEVWRFPDKYWD